MPQSADGKKLTISSLLRVNLKKGFVIDYFVIHKENPITIGSLEYFETPYGNELHPKD
jgi:hypothetical protein